MKYATGIDRSVRVGFREKNERRHQKNLHNSIFILIFVVPNNERYGKE